MQDFATFQHRSGRVGRFGQVGVVCHLITNGIDMANLESVSCYVVVC